jgi:hypothetical protein
MYLHIEEGDLDDRWSELLVRLDACSYYAALAIPFARQVIEGKGKIDGKSRRGVFCDAMEFNFSIDGKERILGAAEMIANNFSELSDSYEALQTADEFAEWCVYFLQAAAVLILLATSQLSIRNGIRGPV